MNKKNVSFIKGDICDQKLMSKLLKNVNIAINVATESHVDNSFNNSFAFTFTNTLGSHVFFENCRINKVKNIIHVSTDEVYGQKFQVEVMKMIDYYLLILILLQKQQLK